jgi:hypothetical protein
MGEFIKCLCEDDACIVCKSTLWDTVSHADQCPHVEPQKVFKVSLDELPCFLS